MSANPTPQEASDFINFVNNSPSPFHAVEEARLRLIEVGYEELKERDCWIGKLKNNGRYYFTRNRSTIVAFAIGGKYAPGNGVTMVGAHTDSPCLKVKPISKKQSCDYLQVGVEPYGGGLWHTWFDRDLSVAGRIMVETGKNKFEHKLVKVTRPILRVPSIAIHLDRSVYEAFKFNKETHLTPLLATATKALEGDDKNAEKDNNKHHPALINILVQELGCKANEIHDFELCLYDSHPSTIGGACNEFIFSPRLDNLMMSYTALTALINSTKDTTETLCDDPNIRLISLFDNEEIGSETAHGAYSLLLESTLRRICSSKVGASQNIVILESVFEETVRKSFMVSADMAHAIHPNYSEKHEENHRPQMNKGVVIKSNANQKYATTPATSLVIRQAAKKYDVPLQEFVTRNDMLCGSTIGPIISARLGIRTIDLGNPQLSMHSIRETAGVDDVGYAIKLFQSYFEDFAEIDQNIIVD